MYVEYHLLFYALTKNLLDTFWYSTNLACWSRCVCACIWLCVCVCVYVWVSGCRCVASFALDFHRLSCYFAPLLYSCPSCIYIMELKLCHFLSYLEALYILRSVPVCLKHICLCATKLDNFFHQHFNLLGFISTVYQNQWRIVPAGAERNRKEWGVTYCP